MDPSRWKKCCTAKETVWPIILQVAVKKVPLKPSGSRELFFFREKTTALISSEEGMEVRRELSELETVGLLIWKREGLDWLAWTWIVAWSSVIMPLTEMWWIELKELLDLAER